ncbi:MAG: FeoB-associated Cys-rich membrane protein [Paludibacteraceae bacterium]|nr:FeoB-associated Cys-rich membrane protein [Paludibacteraceae bacterium]
MEHIIVIVIIIAAIIGIVVSVRRQQNQSPCNSSCSACPLSDKCEKAKSTSIGSDSN